MKNKFAYHNQIDELYLFSGKYNANIYQKGEIADERILYILISELYKIL